MTQDKTDTDVDKKRLRQRGADITLNPSLPISFSLQSRDAELLEWVSCGDIIGLALAMCSVLTWLREKEGEEVYKFTWGEVRREKDECALGS